MATCACGKNFVTGSGLWKHKKSCTAATSIPQIIQTGETRCIEERCGSSFRFIDDLRNHLERCHGMEFHVGEKTFKNYAEFSSWKEETEKLELTCFLRKSCKRRVTADYLVEHFYCNRSGTYQTKDEAGRSRRLKYHGSCKLNNNCTASLKVRTLADGTVKVAYCLTHYGHKKELCHLFMSTKPKQSVACDLTRGDLLTATFAKENVMRDSSIAKDVNTNLQSCRNRIQAKLIAMHSQVEMCQSMNILLSLEKHLMTGSCLLALDGLECDSTEMEDFQTNRSILHLNLSGRCQSNKTKRNELVIKNAKPSHEEANCSHEQTNVYNPTVSDHSYILPDALNGTDKIIKQEVLEADNDVCEVDLNMSDSN